VTLKRLRACASSLVPALLLSLAALAVPHDGHSGHDPDSDFTPVFHDESAHRIGSPSLNREPPGHCAVCHWSRSFRTLQQVTFWASAALETAAFVSLENFSTPKIALAGLPPFRSPPALPIFRVVS
jgi:hypothetical protein